MTHRFPGCAAAILVAVLGLLMLGAPAAASVAAPVAAPVTAPAQVPPSGPAALARLELAELSPRLVTTTSAPVVRVSGRVVNIGNRPISKLGIRLQRDNAVSSDRGLSQALQEESEAPHVTRFQPLPGDLAPGQSSPFQLEVPLRGGAELESLNITKPGVYPVLVNLNGQPDDSPVTRLASLPLLLPVLGLPPVTPGGPPGPVQRPPLLPVPLTMVWPLAAAPVRVPTAPGEPILIRSEHPGTDPLAAELAPGGRLDGLLGALEQELPPGSPLAAAVCVAVDPLLLETLDEMSRGYRVSDPRGISDGAGGPDARSWLDRLRGVVQGRCVLALPYADADLVALSLAGLTDLTALATTAGAGVVEDLLGVKPLAGVCWPFAETLDERTLADLTALQIRAVLLSPQGIAPLPALGPAPAPGQQPVPQPTPLPSADVVALVGSSSSTPNPRDVRAGGPDHAVGLLVDPLLSSALSSTPSTAATQDGLGALVYRATSVSSNVPGSAQGVLLVPPRRWQAGGTEAAALLSTARQLLAAGFVTARELPALASTRPAAGRGSATLIYPPQLRASEIPPQITAEIQRNRDILRDLQVATMPDPTANLRPAALLDPLRLGLLRAASTAWRDTPNRAALVISQESSRLDEVRRSVRIVQPPGPYSLAASDSPLLITVSNELPVAVQVALNLSETAGLRAGAVGLQLVPARSTRQLVIPAEVSRAGQFSVDASLSTAGGTPLGEPSTLQLRSTAFGRVTVALTVGAGGLLLLLVTRRIVRRLRQSHLLRKAG